MKMQKPLLRLGTLTHATFEFRKSLQYYNKYVMNKNINVYFTEVLKLVTACRILQFPCIIKIILMTQYVVFNINSIMCYCSYHMLIILSFHNVSDNITQVISRMRNKKPTMYIYKHLYICNFANVSIIISPAVFRIYLRIFANDFSLTCQNLLVWCIHIKIKSKNRSDKHMC